MNHENPRPVIEPGRRPAPDTTLPIIIYVLYLIGILTAITAVVGVILAYIFRGNGPLWIEEHYRFLIRTFWIGLVYSVLAFILTPVLIGYLLVPLVALWLIIRCVKGLRALRDLRGPDNVGSWMF